MRLAGLLAWLVLGLPACNRQERDESPEQAFGRLHTIAFAGDTVLARRMNAFVEDEGPAAPLEGVREVLAGADVAVVNLECILAARGEPADKGERNPYYFRGRPELARVLTTAGVDVASLANNHAGDYGPDAVVEGVSILRRAGIDPVGAGEDLDGAMAPVFRRIGDTVVAFIGMDMTLRSSAAQPARPGVNYASERDPGAVVRRVTEQVRRARRYANLVFLVTHWGPNGAEEPGQAHRRLARRLVQEAGIDGLLGSSAHQLQGMEVIEGRPIIYDAGNVLFDYGSDDWTHKTAIFVLHLDRGGVRWVEAVPVRMQSNRSRLANADEAEEIVRRLEDLSGRLGTALFTDGGRAMLGIWDEPRARAPAEAYKAPTRPEPRLPTAESYSPAVVVEKLPPTARPLNVAFAEGFELAGYEMPDRSVRRHGVRIVTYWRTTKRATTSYQVFLHVEPRSGGPGWRGDHQPGDWMYPTTRWAPGEVVRDAHDMRPPPDSAIGPHDVMVGLFRAGRRLEVLDDSLHDGQDRVRLGTLEVTE
jgi:poly-gamma-glutamate capsule biosynthesis protein CapA/YwtB (metallophosphatase superfamily)